MMKTTKPGYMRCAIAVFFVVFTFTDLCCAGPCGEQPSGLALAGDAACLTALGDDSPARLAACDTGQEHHSDPALAADDCFCCGNVLPSAQPKVATFNLESAGTDHKLVFLPKPPSRDLFHPPRLA